MQCRVRGLSSADECSKATSRESQSSTSDRSHPIRRPWKDCFRGNRPISIMPRTTNLGLRVSRATSWALRRSEYDGSGSLTQGGKVTLARRGRLGSNSFNSALKVIIALSRRDRGRESIRQDDRTHSGSFQRQRGAYPGFAPQLPTILRPRLNDLGEQPLRIDAQSVRELTELKHVQLPLATLDLPDERVRAAESLREIAPAGSRPCWRSPSRPAAVPP